MIYKIYAFVPLEDMPTSLSTPPFAVDFKTGLVTNLLKETVIFRGERINSSYYAKYNQALQELENLILKVDYTFDRDEEGLLVRKTKLISWMLEDGTWGDSTKKEVSYMIDEREKLREIKIRRSNLVDELKGLGRQVGLSEKLIPFFEEYQVLINQYVDSGSHNLRDAIAASQEAWLDEIIVQTGNKPRDVLIDYFSI